MSCIVYYKTVLANYIVIISLIFCIRP